MNSIISKIMSWISLLPRFTVMNLIEVVIIAVIVYEILLLIKNSKAWTLLKGIIVILVFTMVSALLRLDTILWILERISAIAVIAIVVIFQPELRKALEQLGSQRMFNNLFNLSDHADSNSLNTVSANYIAEAVFRMSAVKTGALIVIEREESLADIISTGIPIDGEISDGLLINIFEKNTPLHDGAVIIKGNRIAAATCYLPLSANMNISKVYGTRHRAAIGISENTDSLSIIVSEETGRVSVTRGGVLSVMKTRADLDSILLELIVRDDKGSRRFGFLQKKKEDA